MPLHGVVVSEGRRVVESVCNGVVALWWCPARLSRKRVVARDMVPARLALWGGRLAAHVWRRR